ncbi:MAG: hypothetical protein HOB73_08165 [Planctomycetaceae bacterium]|jgi:hypothetical protein|nr:hypothetical protein [Planctomycetaceae bacterium]
MNYVEGTVRGYLATFDAPDPSDAYQIVGYQEYANALNHLLPLVQNANAEQLEAYNEIVSELDEFSVYVNLSRQFGRLAGRSVAQRYKQSYLHEFPKTPNDDFRRRGIGWVLALARLEHGAIEIGYQDSANPFSLNNLTAIERIPFTELLLDGARSHYWSMSSDLVTYRLIKGQVTKVNDRTALAYGRRVVMVQHMLEALNTIAGNSFKPVQRNELQGWHRELSSIREGVTYVMYETYRAAIENQDFEGMKLYGCPFLVNGIRRDISEGKGQINFKGDR